MPGYETFELIANNAVTWNWTISASARPAVPSSPGLNTDGVTYDSVFDNLLDSAYYNNPLLLTGTGYNPCTRGDSATSGRSMVQLRDRHLEHLPPGTAEGSIGKNDNFEIKGLLKYDDSILAVYDRWEIKVFYSDNYDNLWNARDVSSEHLLHPGALTAARSQDR